MRVKAKWLALLLGALLVSACSSGGGSGVQGTFQLVEFLESGKDSLPRNRILTFRFSAPVALTQDFAERLKIENIQTNPNSNFGRAIGNYVVVGEEVVFTPRLPEKADRSDAGLKGDANYHVFLKGGPDALVSTDGDRIGLPQEFLFDTSIFFEDPIAAEPPRVVSLVARDSQSGATMDLSRLASDPATLAAYTSQQLIDGGRILEPGVDGPNGPYSIPWQFDLYVSEPIDPATVTATNVQMFETFGDALLDADSAEDGRRGTANVPPYRVPLKVTVIQRPNAQDVLEFIIRVTPVQTLVDDARYRLVFSGNILGLDFRKTFIGDNGLTGDAPEPGGFGYVTEFVVYDRPAISGSRTLTYDPRTDDIDPEQGQTAVDEALFNTALYNPAIAPGTAVGFLADFGNGSDGALAVPGGNIVVLDTGDLPNAFLGSPFTVHDSNPSNEWNPADASGGNITYDSNVWTEWHFESVSISSGGTLRVRGVNPALFRVRGVVLVAGTIDMAGRDGIKGGAGNATGGEAGAGGGKGGDAFAGSSWNVSTSSCQNFSQHVGSAPTSAKAIGPHGQAGTGPGRGQGGGDSWSYVYGETDPSQGLTGTGGGGGSHLQKGVDGDDIRNAGGAEGTPGSACAMTTTSGTGTGWSRNSSVIGVRGKAGPTYGDLEGISILWGGSGGGGGGAQHMYPSFTTGQGSGGSGGGGGGSLTMYVAGGIIGSSGTIDVSGGDGGQGAFRNAYTYYPNWLQSTGGGGGGAGGMMVLISADHIDLSGATVDARGGVGGPASQIGTAITCNVCNGGGAGGKGLIFLMDKDGLIGGLIPGGSGTPLPSGAVSYPNHSTGHLVISDFQGDRFGGSSAITELFPMTAANPAYRQLSTADLKGIVNAGQTATVYMSSAKGDAKDPLKPDLTTEIALREMAVISSTGAGGTTVDITGNMSDLNPGGAPDREAFVRVKVDFFYEEPVQAALGPFASMDEVTIRYQFNG